MRTEIYGVVTFKSTHHTIQAETVFKEKDISFRTIPTPREISVSCGLAIIIGLDDLDGVKSMVEKEEIRIEGVYKYTKEGTGNRAEKINL